MTAAVPVALKTEGSAEPQAVDTLQPVFSWQLQAAGAFDQTGFELRVARTADELESGRLVWDSGPVSSPSSLGFRYGGPDLEPRTTYWWTVRAQDATGRSTCWAQPARFRTGLLRDGAWPTPWIAAPPELRLSLGSGRTLFFARSFELDGPVESAYLYATAQGVYRATLNGHVVELGEQAPGWTAYETRLHYQTADVEPLLRPGTNRLVVAVADGWWAGNIAWWGRRVYGDHCALTLELHLRTADGQERVIATDNTWQVGIGRVVESDLIMGETQDLRLPLDEPASPTSVVVEPPPAARVDSQPHEPMHVHERLRPRQVTNRADGTALIDFGQHLTGRVALRVRGGRPGDVVTIRHGEALDDAGELYLASLRTTRQEDHFILGREAASTLRPVFALHGFRFVEVGGLRGPLAEEDAEAEVVHSSTPAIATFGTANPLVDRLHRNVVWSQKSNFIDIPVDCAQRDERLGWAGDVNLFASTALTLMDCGRFLRSWLRSLADGQLPNGSIPDIAPYVRVPLPPRDVQDGQPGWGDAVVGVPWEVYLQTGDRTVLEELWPTIRAWMAYVRELDSGLIRDGGVFGDWNHLGPATPTEVIGTAWFARSSRTAAAIARALGEAGAASEYAQLHRAIADEFGRRFVAPDGRVEGSTQTAYALALDTGVVPPELVSAAGDHLVHAIADAGWHLQTGFVGTACILDVLTALGRSDVAYRLLAETSFPSWGFQVVNGATAVWEHWDSWHPERGFHDPKMNSFNHFAFATVGGWLYRSAAGIAADPERPGFERVRFRPNPDTLLGDVAARLDSPVGAVESAWSTDGRDVRLRLTVPPNARGVLELPWVDDPALVQPRSRAGAWAPRVGEKGVTVELGSGRWELWLPHPPRDSAAAGADAGGRPAHDELGGEDDLTVGALGAVQLRQEEVHRRGA